MERLEVHGVVSDVHAWRDALEAGRRPPTASTPGSGLTARKLRRVPLGSLLIAMSYFLEGRANEISDFARDRDERSLIPTIETWYAASRRVVERPRPGRPGYSDIEYASVAAIYVSRLPSPRAKAETADFLEISPARAGKLLHEARSRGLLTAAPNRKVGGQLTPEAIQLLNSQEGT